MLSRVSSIWNQKDNSLCWERKNITTIERKAQQRSRGKATHLRGSWGNVRTRKSSATRGGPLAWPDQLTSRAVTEDPHALLPERSALAPLGWEAAGRSQEGPGKPMTMSRRTRPNTHPIRQTRQPPPGPEEQRGRIGGEGKGRRKEKQ